MSIFPDFEFSFYLILTLLGLPIEEYKNQIEIFKPYEKDGETYLRRTDDQREVLYLQATCDELRHGLTNYEQLLISIKERRFPNASEKDAIIYAIKYECTRSVWHEQRKILKQYFEGYRDNFQREQYKIESVKQQIQLQESKKDKLKKDIEEFENRKLTLKLQIKNLQEDKEKLNSEIKFLETRRAELKREVEQLEKRKDILRKEIRLLEEEKENLEHTIQEHKKVLESLKIEISNQSAINDKKDIIFELNKANIQLQQENQALHQENFQLKALCDDLKNKNLQTNQDIKSCQQEIKELEECLKHEIIEYKRQNKSLKFKLQQSLRLSNFFFESGQKIKSVITNKDQEIEALFQSQEEILSHIYYQNNIKNNHYEQIHLLRPIKKLDIAAINHNNHFDHYQSDYREINIEHEFIEDTKDILDLIHYLNVDIDYEYLYEYLEYFDWIDIDEDDEYLDNLNHDLNYVIDHIKYLKIDIDYRYIEDLDNPDTYYDACETAALRFLGKLF